MKKILALLALAAILIIPVQNASVKAAGPTDEILNYTITVDVNEDASLNMLYHIEWKVLDDSASIGGPVSWVQIGIPNSHYISCESLSDNIESITMIYEDSEYRARIDFKKEYHKNEVISFDYLLVQDYMYEMNKVQSGETVYYFIPGWFDEIAVDNIEINWNADKATLWSSGAKVKNGRLIWTGKLAAGAEFGEISVTYPNDAFSFNESRSRSSSDYYVSPGEDDRFDYGGGNYSYNNDSDNVSAFFGLIFLIAIIWFIVSVIKKATDYTSGSGFSSTTTSKKITRTLIKYYPTCPGCGANRPENAETCEYCGRSFIESEEVLEEKEIKEPEKYKKEGTFRYGSSPNTYIRVHVTPVHIPVSSSRSRSSSSRGGGSHHSSCVHSSCACAHSCACACACACAGGGRAGCSTKDFYNTNLKLRQLKRAAEARKR